MYEETLKDIEHSEFNRYIRDELVLPCERLAKQLDNEFVEAITRAYPKEVKERRVGYLWDEAHKMLEEAYFYLELMVLLGVPVFLVEMLNEDEIDPRFIKIRNCLFQIKMWEAKEFIEEKEMDYDTDAIKARYNIVDVVKSYGVELRTSGIGRFVGRCPFHNERTGSFVVYEKGDAHCFGCGENVSDVIDFVMKMENCNFREACKKLL